MNAIITLFSTKNCKRLSMKTMKNTNYYLTIVATICFVLCQKHSIAQQFMPDYNKILNYTEIEDVKTDANKKGDTDWFVFSDRPDNKIYSSSSSTSGVRGRADFLQMFKVKSETDKYLELTDPDDPGNVIGWMPKNNLVLFVRSMRKPNKVAKKAMIINKLEDLKRNKKNNQFYKDPELREVIPDETINVYTICYVYKRNPKDSTVLLGSREDCSSNARRYFQDQIFGWIHEDFLTEWNNRGCLQPNYREGAPEARSPEHPAVLFEEEIWPKLYMNNWKSGIKDLEDTLNYIDYNPLTWNDDMFSSEPWDASKFRLPFLDRTEYQGVFKVGVLGNIEDTTGKAMMELIESLRAEFNKQKSLNNLNVVFVIDGTKSMKKYFPYVVDAINESAEFILSEYSADSDNPIKLNVNWGAAIYRDSAEDKYAIEMSDGLKSNYKSFSKWLGNVYQDHKNLHDKDVCEALNYGLFMALEGLLAGKEEENNLVILIGDAGNHNRGDWTSINNQTIIDALVRLNCHFIAYQTHFANKTDARPQDSSYKDFIDSTRYIAEESARRIYRKSHSAKDAENIRMIEDKNNMTWKLNENVLANIVIYNTGADMDEEVLQEHIVKSTVKAAENTNLFLNMLYDILYAGTSLDDIRKKYGIEDDQLTTADHTTLAHLSEEVQKYCQCVPGTEKYIETMEWLLSEKRQLYEEGYTSIKAKGVDRRLWDFDILTSSSDLVQLIDDIDKVTRACRGSSGHERRKSIFNALTQLANTYAGEEAKSSSGGSQESLKAKLGEMTIGNLFEQIIDCPGIGFSSNYNYITNLSINDIMRESVSSENLIKVLCTKLTYANKSLRQYNIKENSTKNFKTFTAFWVPIDLFPFMK